MSQKTKLALIRATIRMGHPVVFEEMKVEEFSAAAEGAGSRRHARVSSPDENAGDGWWILSVDEQSLGKPEALSFDDMVLKGQVWCAADAGSKEDARAALTGLLKWMLQERIRMHAASLDSLSPSRPPVDHEKVAFDTVIAVAKKICTDVENRNPYERLSDGREAWQRHIARAVRIAGLVMNETKGCNLDSASEAIFDINPLAIVDHWKRGIKRHDEGIVARETAARTAGAENDVDEPDAPTPP